MYLRHCFPEYFLIRLLGNFSVVVSWLQHQLYFFNYSFLSLNFLHKLKENCEIKDWIIRENIR